MPLIINVIMILLLMVINWSVCYTTNNMKPQSTEPFECGFTMTGSPRKPFSLSFYIMGLVFLFFDAEIILLLPMMLKFNFMMNMWMYSYMLVLTLIIISLLFEWLDGSLDW
uniref:NADH-ubiquinone oxidoreductase chain 3 n=1 Tax=Sacculina sp. 'Beibu Gulf' TaxID=2861897 RepID=A0A8F9W8R1_9CRUS|nr:NADH dehydrogenase subunit 3 [Sacculina sp. 'Beibu Gulf']